MLGNVPDGMANLLARKYAILQQQADAGTTNANTAAASGASDVALNDVRMKLMPVESAANVGKVNAETGFIGQQAKYYGPEATARIAGLNASTTGQTYQNQVLKRTSLDPIGRTFGFTPGGSLSSLGNVMGRTWNPLGLGTPINKPRDQWTADDLDKYNGL